VSIVNLVIKFELKESKKIKKIRYYNRMSLLEREDLLTSLWDRYKTSS